MKVVYLFSMIVIVFSCQTVRIEKRLYNHGYAIFWKKKVNKACDKIALNLIEPNADEAETLQKKNQESITTKDIEFKSISIDSQTIVAQNTIVISETDITSYSQSENESQTQIHGTVSQQHLNKVERKDPISNRLETSVRKDDPRILPVWLVITLTILIIAGLCFSSLAIMGLSVYLYLEFNLLFLAILSGTVLGYLFFFLCFWGLFSVLKRESQQEINFARKASLQALFGIVLGVLWGLSLLAISN